MDEAKKKTEKLTLNMQFFCLDPRLENYREISSSTKLKNEQGDLYDIWNLAVLAKYGRDWNLDIENNKFKKESDKISSLLLLRPSSKLLDKMWYIFFATGEITVLQAAFEVAGNQKSSKELKDYALNMFETIREKYREVSPAGANIFKRFDEILHQNTEKLKKMDHDVLNDSDSIDRILSGSTTNNNSNSDSDNESENSNDSENSDIDEKKKLKKKIKEASSLFDEIAKDVMGKVQLSKKR
jgi:hypothetical protein